MTDSEDVKVYPFQGTFEELRNKTFVILHTSGSTGIPKPVFVTHGTFACNDAHQMIPLLGENPTTVDYIKGKRVFIAFPLFHAANLGMTVGFNVFAGLTCVLPPPGPLTVDVVDMVHTFGNVHGSLMPPSMIIDIYNNEEYLVNMERRLQFLAYLGGTLAKEVGDSLSSRLKLMTLMGSTEHMYLPIELNEDSVDWEYIPISPFLGHEFRLSRDALSELVVVRNENFDIFQGVFSTFPDIDEYPTSDLYEQHPIKLGSWIFQGRADDIISFSNAEKLNPVTMEGVISAHPKVRSAIVGGQGEFQASLLVEPKVNPTTLKEKEQLIHDMWPTIAKANQDCPAHGRIMRDFIMFTSPEKPMPRAGKDTVQRYATLKLYAEEFKCLYARSTPQTQLPNGVPSAMYKLPGVAPESPTPRPLVDESATDNSMTESSTATGSIQPFASSSVPVYAASDLDAQIELVLRRLLPEALPQHLGPALAQMMANLLHTTTAPAKVSNQVNGICSSTSSPSQETQLPAAREDGPDSQVQVSAMKPHASGHVSSLKRSKSIINAPEDLRDVLYRAISSNTYLHDVIDQADLFDCGLDSLQISALVNEINALLVKSGPHVALVQNKTIYENSSIEKLLMALEKSA